MEFLCRACGRREGEPEGWLLVVEMSKPGSDIRNTLFIMDRWDNTIARQSNAACFCSEECKGRYLELRHQQLVA